MTLSRQDLSEARDWLCRTLSPVWAEAPLSEPPQKLWPEIVRLADVWLVMPRLHDRCANADFVPPDAMSVLRAVSDFARARDDAMRKELVIVIRALNEAGLEPVVFKGAEWLMGHYAPQARRLISDIDLWCPEPAGQAAAISVLVTLGYRPHSSLDRFDRQKSHHFPPFHKDGATARIELHHRLIRSSLVDSLDLSAVAERLQSTDQQGLHYRRLAYEDALAVAFLQAGRMAAPSFETRKVTAAKWLDFLDRYEARGWQPIVGPETFGIIDGPQEVDVQLLTVLKRKFGFPYEGPVDDRYLTEWTDPRPMTLSQSLRQSLTWRNLTSPQAWVRFISGFRDRVRGLRSLRRL